MSSFFKKIFKVGDSTESNKNDEGIVKIVNDDAVTQEIINIEDNSIDTNKLPEISDDYTGDELEGFSSYLFFSETNKGMVRQSNQDSIFTGINKYKIVDKPVCIGMAIVADGMGGLSRGEMASSTAIASVCTYMGARISEYIEELPEKTLPDNHVIQNHINDAVRNANRLVFEKGLNYGERIGTTFTGAILLGRNVFFGHAGDSRAYIIDTEKKSMERVSKDHSLVGRLIEMGQITEKEAKSHPRRNEIYKMLGLREEIDIDTYHRTIDKNKIILLMSDGLWEFVDDEDILNLVINGRELSEAVKKLVALANINGGFDNISLILIKPVE